MKSIILVLVAVLLAGCGGGGGDAAAPLAAPVDAVVKTSIVDGAWQRTYIADGLVKLAESIAMSNGNVTRTQYIGSAYSINSGTFTVAGTVLTLHFTSSSTGTLPADMDNPAYTMTIDTTENHAFIVSGSTMVFAADGVYLEKVFTK